MGDGNFRNDLLIRTPPGAPIASADIDVNITTLLRLKLGRAFFLRPTETAAPTPEADFTATHVYPRLKVERDVKLLKADNLTNYPDRHLFTPFILSAGGITDPETTDFLSNWHAKLPVFIYNTMLDDMAAALVRARATGWHA